MTYFLLIRHGYRCKGSKPGNWYTLKMVETEYGYVPEGKLLGPPLHPTELAAIAETEPVIPPIRDECFWTFFKVG